ncbi:uncharacterized protein LOC124266249 [Haliotis rubra]|uniref:uncharacterized protein LOC124266249 n=1 Tax=Haliotis rubra TaxID=36100 RepID=UPI001EE5C4D1|nr:uncharacterized protein LOC124266249 [Haliotis rubra]
MNLRTRGNTNWKRIHEGSPIQSSPRLRSRSALPGLFQVERLITRRRLKEGTEYLVKWQGYPIEQSTWEPDQHIPASIRRSYDQPEISDCQRETFSRDARQSFQSRLKTRGLKFSVPCHLNVFRALLRTDRETLLGREELEHLCLPPYWWYNIDKHGEGTCVEFPVRAKPCLRQRTKYTVHDGRVAKISIPVETVVFQARTRACTLDMIHS